MADGRFSCGQQLRSGKRNRLMTIAELTEFFHKEKHKYYL